MLRIGALIRFKTPPILSGCVSSTTNKSASTDFSANPEGRSIFSICGNIAKVSGTTSSMKTRTCLFIAFNICISASELPIASPSGFTCAVTTIFSAAFNFSAASLSSILITHHYPPVPLAATTFEYVHCSQAKYPKQIL